MNRLVLLTGLKTDFIELAKITHRNPMINASESRQLSLERFSTLASTARRNGLSGAAIMALAGLTVVAFALRLFRLNEIPPGMFLDEAINGLDVLDILGGNPSLFFERNGGREPLFFYLIAPFVAWLGREPLAVRLPAALAGAATVPGTFLLVRELLWREGARRATLAALLASGLLAGSFWAISVNRIGFRANTLPLMMTLAFWLSWRTLRLGGSRQAALAGGLLGLCFYTYLAGRFVYPLALTAIGILAMSNAGRLQLQLRRRELLIMGLVCGIIMLPLVLYFTLHWQDFIGRARILVDADHNLYQGDERNLLVRSIIGHFGMFGGPGDPQVRHNIPHRSALTPWLAVLFWAGLALCLLRGRQRPERWFAVSWFFWLLLPSVLAVVDTRHFIRTIGLLPVIYFFPAVALLDFQQWYSRRLSPSLIPRANLAMLLFGVMLFATETAITIHAYFDRWANDPRVASAFSLNEYLISNEIDAAPNGVIYVLPQNGNWESFGNKLTFDFLIEDRKIVYPFFPAQAGSIEGMVKFVQRHGGQELRIVRMTDGEHVSGDPSELASLLAGQMAQPLGTYADHGYYVEVYRIDDRPIPATLPQSAQPANLAFGQASSAQLILEAWGVNGDRATVSSGGLGLAALRWRVAEAPDRLLSASLRLLDDLGNVVGQADHLLVDDRPQYTDQWLPAEQATTYLPVVAAPGTLPGVYRLALAVYEPASGRRLTIINAGKPSDVAILGDVLVGPARSAASAYQPTYRLSQPWPVGSNTRLVGHEAIPADGQPGLPLDLVLALEKSGDDPTQTELHFALGDREIKKVMLGVPEGGLSRVAVRLSLPQDLSPGDYPLRIRGISAGDWLDLHDISITKMPEVQASLGAYFTNGIVLDSWHVDRKEEGTAVTLLWHTSEPQHQDYSVFVHLLDPNGQIIAQNDSQPDRGRYPTTVWPVGATVSDQHLLVTEIQPGMTLRVGMYLPGSGERLPLQNGADSVDWVVEELP